MNLTFTEKHIKEISETQRRASLTTRRVCEIKNQISNQIKEELHAKTLTNLGTEEIEFKCVCVNLPAVSRYEID